MPQDRQEQALIEQIQVASGVTSRYSALVRLLGDAEAASEELLRIQQEEAENAAKASRIAGGGVEDLEEDGEEQEGQSSSSKQALARARQERGQNDNQAGRDPRKRPRLGG